MRVDSCASRIARARRETRRSLVGCTVLRCARDLSLRAVGSGVCRFLIYLRAAYSPCVDGICARPDEGARGARAVFACCERRACFACLSLCELRVPCACERLGCAVSCQTSWTFVLECLA